MSSLEPEAASRMRARSRTSASSFALVLKRRRVAGSGPAGPLDQRWNIVVNTEIEPDL